MVKWKLVLAAVVVVAILALIITTPVNQKITDITGIDFNFINFGKILSGLTTLLSPVPSGNYFTFVLESDNQFLYGRSFDVENGSLILSGNFVTDVFVGDTVYDVSSTKGSVEIENFKGTVKFGNYDTVEISGKATGVSINGGTKVRPSGEDFSIKLEIVPSEYFIAPVLQNEMKFTGVTGKIERTDDKPGSWELKGEDVEIISFIGNFKLSNDFSISGAAKIVKSKTVTVTG